MFFGMPLLKRKNLGKFLSINNLIIISVPYNVNKIESKIKNQVEFDKQFSKQIKKIRQKETQQLIGNTQEEHTEWDETGMFW